MVRVVICSYRTVINGQISCEQHLCDPSSEWDDNVTLQADFFEKTFLIDWLIGAMTTLPAYVWILVWIANVVLPPRLYLPVKTSHLNIAMPRWLIQFNSSCHQREQQELLPSHGWVICFITQSQLNHHIRKLVRLPRWTFTLDRFE